MKKNIIAFLSTIVATILISFFVQEMVAKNLLYLHQQNQTVRSNQEHLNQFITFGDVILMFYSETCPPCHRMSPIIDAVASILPQFIFIKIERKSFPDLRTAYNITSVPTLIFLRNGKEIARYDGGPLTEEKMQKLITSIYVNSTSSH